MKVCVIGMGPIGNLHARIYSSIPGIELAGVCDIIDNRASEAGRHHKTAWYTDARTMLEKIRPDVCSITTGGYEYSSDHYLPTLQALEAGAHVLCEKPICNEIKPAREMVKKAQEKGLCLGVNLNHRFTPAARMAKQWQNDGLLGDMLFVNMALWIGKFNELESEYYHIKALNPHSIDIMRYFCGNIKKVHCFAMKAPGRNIFSTASMNMQFENGAVGHLTSSYDIKRGHPMERCEAAGTKGRIVIEDIWREAVLYPAGDPVKKVFTNPIFGGFESFDDTFKDRIGIFIDQIKDGVTPDMIDASGKDGLLAQEVIDAAIRSLKTGKAVEITKEDQ